MKVGLSFFFTARSIGVVELAQAIEAKGFSALYFPDHTVIPSDPSISYRGHGPMPEVLTELPDPFVLMAIAATATTTLEVGTGIALVPERHPLTLAKLVSTVDHYSNGRVTLGIGAGWCKQETEVYGIAFKDRWEYMRESVLAMKQLWREGEGSYDGQFVSFPPLYCKPQPKTKGGPPVLFGVPNSPEHLKVAARYYDGWIANGASPGSIARGREVMLRECELIGRDPAELKIVAMGFDLTPETLAAYERSGVDMVVGALYNHPGTALSIEQRAEFHKNMVYKDVPSAEETLEVLDRLAELTGVGG